MSEIASFKMFDSHPDSAVPKESPLAWSFSHSGVPERSKESGILMQERAYLGHLTLRGGAIALDKALRKVLNLSLPAQPLSLVSDQSGDYSAQWMSPDEWLLIVPQGKEFEVEQKLREALGKEHYAIVNVSGGQTLISLEGDNVRELLMKSVTYDVHPNSFPAGKGVATVFAKASVILRRPDERRWELVVRRSFADYTWRWLLDAGAEYGIAVSH